jgi:hypothetical protein
MTKDDDDDDDSGDRRRRKRPAEKKKMKRSEKSRRRRREDDDAAADDDDDDSVGSSRSRDHKKHSKKKSKKHSKKDHHSSKRHKSDDRKEERHSSSEQRRPNNLYDLGVIYGRSPVKQLSSTDYYDFHKHLWLYLYRTKNLIFDELSSEETHRYFADFCREYNRGQLPTAYYEAKLPRQAVDECPTTRHQWGFNASKELEILQQSVYQQTEQEQQQQPSARGAPTIAPTTNAPTVSKVLDARKQPEEDLPIKKRPLVGPARPPPNEADDHQASSSSSSQRQRSSRFDRAGDQEKLVDIRERRLLEKSQIGERIHGAHRDNRDAAAAVELTDDALYGGDASMTDFQRALAQQKRRTASRQDRQAVRIAELKEKEAQKQKDMLERLGVAKR